MKRRCKFPDEVTDRVPVMRAAGHSLLGIARELSMSVGMVSIVLEEKAPQLINRRGPYKRFHGAGSSGPSYPVSEGTHTKGLDKEQAVSYRWTPGRKIDMPPLPVVDNGFIRPPTREQLMGGHARMARV